MERWRSATVMAMTRLGRKASSMTRRLAMRLTMSGAATEQPSTTRASSLPVIAEEVAGVSPRMRPTAAAIQSLRCMERRGA